jgi:hypothetical protein
MYIKVYWRATGHFRVQKLRDSSISWMKHQTPALNCSCILYHLTFTICHFWVSPLNYLACIDQRLWTDTTSVNEAKMQKISFLLHFTDFWCGNQFWKLIRVLLCMTACCGTDRATGNRQISLIFRSYPYQNQYRVSNNKI